jgi:nucleoside-diphosphate-sugar epimerase
VKILVTGACGFVCSTLIRELAEIFRHAEQHPDWLDLFDCC